jgi:hypothetical protein
MVGNDVGRGRLPRIIIEEPARGIIDPASRDVILFAQNE